MIRPEIQNFINYIEKNKESFKFLDSVESANRGICTSGFTNGIYEISYYFIKDKINWYFLELDKQEGEQMSVWINYFKERDIHAPLNAKANTLLICLGNL